MGINKPHLRPLSSIHWSVWSIVIHSGGQKHAKTITPKLLRRFVFLFAILDRCTFFVFAFEEFPKILVGLNHIKPH